MLEELKKEVLRVSRLAEETGLCHHGGGNFSQIDRESGLVVITPHAESRYNFNAEDMLVVDLDGNIIENSIIGENCKIINSYISESRIKDRQVVGPYEKIIKKST